MFPVKYQRFPRKVVFPAAVVFMLLSLISLGVPAEPAPKAAVQKPASPKVIFDTVLIVENDVEIKTRLTGIIEEILVERGSKVSKGDPLARLQNEASGLEVQKTKIRMQEQESQYQRAKTLF